MKYPKIIRRQILGYSSEWIKKFDVREYLYNPPLIEKLHEEKQIAFKISENVNKLLSIKEVSSGLFDKTQAEVDSLIFDLYQISKENRNHISKFIANTEKL